MKRIYLPVLGFFMATGSLGAQTIAKVKLGQICPDITMDSILNYPRTSAKISDYRGKLLILDFWATWCGACINMFPKEDSLNKEFAGKVEILPVDYESSGNAREFLDAYEKRKHLIIPSVTGDTVLVKMFPHMMLPHYVWIDSIGKVIGSTGPEEIYRDTILAVLNQHYILNKETDYWIHVDMSKPVLLNMGSSYSNSLIYSSILTGYIPGMPSKGTITPFDSIEGRRFTAVNYDLKNLLEYAFADDKYMFPGNTTFLDVLDSTKFNTDASGQACLKWLQSNGYCYELIVPPQLKDQFYSILHQNLINYLKVKFNLSVTVEKRTMRCWALIRTSNIDKIHTKGGPEVAGFNGMEGAHMRNLYLIYMIGELEYIFMERSKIPFVNETNYLQKVDMDLNANLSDMTSVNAALAKYDLQFVQKDAPVDCLVIKQGNSPSPEDSSENHSRKP